MNSKSRTNNIIRNVFFGVGCRFIDVVFNFFVRILFVKILGEEILGINGLFTNILTWLSLADLGFGTAMSFSFYKPLAEKDEKKLSALTHFYKNVYLIIMIAILVVGLGLVPFLDVFINMEKAVSHVQSYYVILLLNTAASYLFVYKTAILRADQNEYVISTCNTLFNIVRALVQIVLLLFYKNYHIFLIIQVVFTMTNNIVVSKIVDKKYPFLKEKAELSKAERKKIYENVGSVLIYKVSGTLLNGTDNILISMIIGTIYVGYYSNYLLVINSITVFVNVIFSSVYGSLGNLLHENNKEKNERSFNLLLYVGYFIATISSACFFGGFNDFIGRFFGTKYILDSFTVVAIVMNYYLSCICQPIWTFRETCGLFKKVKYVMLITATINLILSIILGYIFGIFGIIIASAISRIVTYFWYEPVLLYQDYFESNVNHYLKRIGKYLLVSLVSLLPSFILFQVSNFNILIMFVKIILSAMSSFCIFLFLTRKDPSQNRVFMIIKGKLNRKGVVK